MNPWWGEYANDPLMRIVARDFGSDVEAYLEEAIAGLAIPDDIVTVSALQRTAGGGVDRASLPLDETPVCASDSDRKPRGPIETVLASVWREILAIDDVGRTDNFFDLGGDSRHALQVVAGAKRFGIELTLQNLMQHQTIRELAAGVAAAEAIPIEAHKPRDPEIVQGPVPLGAPHRRIIEAADEDYFIQRMLVLNYQCRRRLRAEPLGRAIEHLVSHHDALRIELRRDAAGALTLWNAEAPRARADLLWVIDLSHLEADQQSEEISRLSAKLRDVTDLSRLAMSRFALIDRGAHQNQLLLVAVHHAIWDAITAGIFFDDVKTLYDQAARGRELRLLPKTSSLKLWTERFEAEGPALVADEVPYWRQRLTDRGLLLPLDGEPAQPGDHGYRIAGVLTSRETRAIQRAVQDECDATSEEILAAAVAIAVARWTGQRKVGINLLQHGRDRLLDGVDVSRTIGWFTSECPLILDLSEADSLIQAVRIARNAARQVPRNGLGYMILRYLDPTRPLADCPPPRIMLNHQGVGTFLTTGPLRLMQIDEAFEARHINVPNAPIHLMSRIVGGALETLWTCNRTVAREQTIRALAEGTMRALRELITTRENSTRSTCVEFQ